LAFTLAEASSTYCSWLQWFGCYGTCSAVADLFREAAEQAKS